VKRMTLAPSLVQLIWTMSSLQVKTSLLQCTSASDAFYLSSCHALASSLLFFSLHPWLEHAVLFVVIKSSLAYLGCNSDLPHRSLHNTIYGVLCIRCFSAPCVCISRWKIVGYCASWPECSRRSSRCGLSCALVRQLRLPVELAHRRSHSRSARQVAGGVVQDAWQVSMQANRCRFFRDFALLCHFQQ
jgi:hypothetical protein